MTGRDEDVLSLIDATLAEIEATAEPTIRPATPEPAPQPAAGKRWRVVRQASTGGTGIDVCAHRWEWRAWRCARRLERAEESGVFFDVRPAVADA